MKLTDKDKVAGVEQIPDGKYSLEIVEPISYQEKEGTATDNLMVGMEVRGGDQDGRKKFIFCDLSGDFGKIRLAKIVGFSGLDKMLEKKYPKIDNSLGPVDWGRKYINTESKNGRALINDIQVMLPGYFIDVTWETSTGRDGKEYQNPVEFDYCEKEITKPESKGERKAEPETEDEDW